MKDVNLLDVDLNLLVALEVLLEERNVTRAGKRLRRTQSATSHALARLREAVGDPLLVRVGGEMRLTPKAEALALELPRVLRMIQGILGAQSAFDPAASDRLFTLTGPDFVAALLPALVQRVAREAPKASVEFVTRDRQMFSDLADGRYDAAVAPGPRAPPGGLAAELLGELPWLVFARRGHPALRSWSLEAWTRWPHVLVRTPPGPENPLERALRERGLKRTIAVYLPAFTLAAPLLAATDLLMTVPREALSPLASQFGLAGLEPPLALDPLPLVLYSSARLAQDGAMIWFRAMVQAAFADALGEGERLAVARVKGKRA